MDVKRIAGFILCFEANLIIYLQPLKQVMIYFKNGLYYIMYGISPEEIKEEIEI